MTTSLIFAKRLPPSSPTPLQYHECKHNLWGLIASNTKYKIKYEVSFACPQRIAVYDTSIPRDAKTVYRAQMEKQHNKRASEHHIY